MKILAILTLTIIGTHGAIISPVYRLMELHKPLDDGLPNPIEDPVEDPIVELPKPIEDPVELPEPIEDPVELPKPIEDPVDELPTKPIEDPVELPKPIEDPIELPKPIEDPVELPKPIEDPVALPKPIEGEHHEEEEPVEATTEHVPETTSSASSSSESVESNEKFVLLFDYPGRQLKATDNHKHHEHTIEDDSEHKKRWMFGWGSSVDEGKMTPVSLTPTQPGQGNTRIRVAGQAPLAYQPNRQYIRRSPTHLGVKHPVLDSEFGSEFEHDHEDEHFDKDRALKHGEKHTVEDEHHEFNKRDATHVKVTAEGEEEGFLEGYHHYATARGRGLKVGGYDSTIETIHGKFPSTLEYHEHELEEGRTDDELEFHSEIEDDSEKRRSPTKAVTMIGRDVDIFIDSGFGPEHVVRVPPPSKMLRK